ncbi:MAG: type II toxin-antitoxin system VapC family toxin [Gemmatimonadaceae bacterium]
MRILLDTHVLIWWDENARLSRAARSAIESADQVYVSAVSGWEIALKASLGRLRPTRTVADAIEDSQFEELPLRLQHTEALLELPWHHRDPFDRVLIAQALSERLTIVSRDRAFSAYDVPLINA